MPALRDSAHARAGAGSSGRRCRRWWCRSVAHVADIERRAVDPDLAAAGTIDMRNQRGVRTRQTGHLLARNGPSVTVEGPGARRRRLRPGGRRRRCLSRPHFLNSSRLFSVGSSLATNSNTGSLSEPLTCSHQAPPGTASVSNCLPVEALAVDDRIAAALERRDQQARGLSERLRLFARAQHLHEERDGLEHRPAGESDRHIRPSAPRRGRRPSPCDARAGRASSPSDRRYIGEESLRAARPCWTKRGISPPWP